MLTISTDVIRKIEPSYTGGICIYFVDLLNQDLNAPPSGLGAELHIVRGCKVLIHPDGV